MLIISIIREKRNKTIEQAYLEVFINEHFVEGT